MRDLAFLDLETTGLDPLVHEILEAAVVRVDGRTLEELASTSVRIHPLHLERADPEALAVNGFAEPWGGGSLEAAMLQIEPLLEDATLAGHCVARFDLPFLLAAHRTLCWDPPRVGKMVLDTQSMLWPLYHRGEITSLSLAAACDYYGISNAGAHGALVDARRALEVARVRLLCQCHLEAGDSPCRYHGDTECSHCGASFVEAKGHDCPKAPPPQVAIVRFDAPAKEGGRR